LSSEALKGFSGNINSQKKTSNLTSNLLLDTRKKQGKKEAKAYILKGSAIETDVFIG